MDEVDETIAKAHKAAERHDLQTMSDNIDKYAQDHECCYIVLLARQDEDKAISRSLVSQSCGDVMMAMAAITEMVGSEVITMDDLKELVTTAAKRKIARRVIERLIDQLREDGDDEPQRPA